MKTIKLYITAALVCLFCISASAQYTNTLYFLYDAPTRHYLNPSFAPSSDGYFLLPAIGWTSFGIGNNSLSLKDVIYPNTLGNTATALNPYATSDGSGAQQLYRRLHNSLKLNADADINLLSFGFRTNDTYVHIFLNERFDSYFGMRKDLFGLLLNGGMNIDGENLYSLNKTGLDAKLYTELGFGISQDFNDQWSWGIKAKYLYGSAHIGAYSNNLGLNLSANEWTATGEGVLLASGPFGYETYNKMEEAAPIKKTSDGLELQIQPFNNNYFAPKGHGAAVDLGVTFKPLDMLTVTAAVTDLGFICWNKGYKYNATINADFTGIGEFNYSDYTDENPDGTKTFNTQRLSDTISTHLTNIFNEGVQLKDPTDGYWSMITAKLNVGIEGNFFDKQLNVGVFSQTKFYKNKVFEEVTLGLAYRPRSWFNLAVSYSFLNGRWSNIGAGLILRGGPIGLTLSADYIPLVYTQKVNFSDSFGMKMPYNTKGLNLGLGISVQFGYKHDRDRDRVKDEFDMCPNTPRHVKVDKYGCPLDEDGDGIPDYIDECPGTPESAFGLVDDKGCPFDSDNDGVPDYLDRCPDTPSGLPVDSVGCPLDGDKDGVPDYRDKCPGTPLGVVVDENGCSLDSDGDGVNDVDDMCPGTPVEAYGTIDQHGCPIDSDNDGVPDYLDRCPETPAEAGEKQRREGVRYIDNAGCEIDTDGDGVPDWKDNCISVPGPDFNKGCPGQSKEMRELFQRALNGIQFETGSARIKPVSYSILNEVGNLILQNPNWNVEIQGHTDSTGKYEKNMVLSQDRAESVKAYLVNYGVPAQQLTANGFGPTEPVASNETAAGRAKNRRVVFNVTYEEVTYKTVYEE